MKIIHYKNFQTIDLYLIYLTFNFTLKSMRRTCLIAISSQEIIIYFIFIYLSIIIIFILFFFYTNLLVESCIYFLFILGNKTFLIVAKVQINNSSQYFYAWKSQHLFMYYSCKFGLLYFHRYWTIIIYVHLHHFSFVIHLISFM
jgi:hypothetical protein